MSEQIDQAFTSHVMNGAQSERAATIRASAKQLAQLIEQECAVGRERSLALTNLEQASFWAVAAIAREVKP